MICDECTNIIVLQAFTTTECKECNAKIITGHIPGYQLCDSCSSKLNKCKQCGK